MKPTKVLQQNTLNIDTYQGQEYLQSKKMHLRPTSAASSSSKTPTRFTRKRPGSQYSRTMSASSDRKTPSRLFSKDKVLQGVDEDKFVQQMMRGENSESVDRESLSRYYAFHKLKSQLTRSQPTIASLTQQSPAKMRLETGH